jgi:hypothetical protein
MVLGHDIGLVESVTLSLTTLVGRYSYINLCRIDRSEWVNFNWKPLSSYSLEITYLTQGWISFIFKTTEDSSAILEQFWTIDGGSLMLKCWRINFDPIAGLFPS